MGIRIFTAKRLELNRTVAQIAELTKHFREYKENGVQPSLFGRDESYDRPASAKYAELQHIHLNYDTGWPLKIVKWRRTSDEALVYCAGWHSRDNYLLIAFLDNAHKQAQKVTFMSELAEEAEKFRSRF